MDLVGDAEPENEDTGRSDRAWDDDGWQSILWQTLAVMSSRIPSRDDIDQTTTQVECQDRAYKSRQRQKTQTAGGPVIRGAVNVRDAVN